MADERELRALPVSLEVRAADEESDVRTIAGVIRYDDDSKVMRDYWGDEFVEQIAAGAFADSLKTRDVVGLWSHNTAAVLGNTKSGTLRITDTSSELRFELDIPKTSVGNDAWELIKRGDVDGISFGMRVTKEKWSSEERENGKMYKRSVLGAELFEISPVAFPAYPTSEVAVRSLQDFKEGEKRASERAADELTKRKLEIELELM